MNPIINYELGKALHKEREAEFERSWRLHAGAGIPQNSLKKYRVMVGVGSIAMGALLIVQRLSR